MSEKRPLEWSPRSQRDIEAIHDYIALDNPVAAQSVIAEIRKAANSLRTLPMLGHVGKCPGTRELVLARFPYTLVYRLAPAKISIAAVLHQSRQYP